MSVNNIQPESNIDALNRQRQLQMLQNQPKDGSVDTPKKATDSQDTVEISQMAKEINKYKKMMEDIPEPNEGRIAELKEAVKNGTLINSESIQGTAAAITNVMIP